MRIFIHSYDLDDEGASGTALRAMAGALAGRGATVWATPEPQPLAELRAWAPDLVVGQQWATEAASAYATGLGRPFVMLVHGPGQYEHAMPQCDLVILASDELLRLARPALGATPAMVLPTDAIAAACDPLWSALQQVAAAGRRRPTLTLCMTVANEAATLEQAVRSAAPYADVVVIGVDRRSSDATAAIAERLATRCFSYEESSPPNFPRMRNRAMALIHTDWALVLDGHEWIEHGELIRPALESTAWSLEIETLFEPDERRVPGLAFLFPRIHRRHVRFAGAPAHEEVAVPVARRAAHPAIKVWHERKPGRAATERGRQKAGAELELLRAAWTSGGDRRALFYLANGLRESGRYDEAIAAYSDYLRAPNFAEEGWLASLYLARCHAAREAWAEARDGFERALLAWPQRAEPAIGLGHTLLAVGQPDRAAAWFRMAAALPQPAGCRLFVEVPAYRWQAWHGLALALAQLGDPAAAAVAEERAHARGAGDWALANIARWRAG